MLPLALALIAAEGEKLTDGDDALVAKDIARAIEAPTSKTRLAVMGLQAAGVPEEYAAGITETIAGAADGTGVFDTVSPRQIQSLLAYESRKELLGGCVEEKCYVQVAKLVRAPHLVGGTVAKVGERLSLNLVLLDALEGKALKRTTDETDDPSKLMETARRAIIVLLQPVLSARRGYLKVAVNVPDAAIIVDEGRRSEGVGQVIELAAGPHILTVQHDGFYQTTSDVFIAPGRVATEDVKLIPAKETIETYESSAKWMRYGAYTTAVLAVGAAVAGGVFYARATNDLNIVNDYAALTDAERAGMDAGPIYEANDSFSTNQALYLSFLAGAVVSAGVSLWLFLAGDDPDRYEEFRSLAGLE
jgi:hypothetical protein